MQVSSSQGRYSSSLPSMILAALSFAFMTFFVKLAAKHVGTNEVIIVRAAVTAGISYATVKYLRVPLWGTNKGLLIVRGLCGFGALLCLYTAVTLLPLADATVLQYTNPVFTAVLGAIILREPFGRTEFLGTLASLSGVILIARPSFLFGQAAAPPNPFAVGLGLLGALCSAGAYVTIRKLKGKEDPNLIIFYFPLVTFLGSIPITFFTEWKTPTLLEWVYMIIGVSVSAQLGQVFLTRGLHRETAGRAMAMSYMQILFAGALAAIFMSEMPTIYTIAGGIMVMLGTLIAARKPTSGVGDE